MKTASQYLDGFIAFARRKHKNKTMVPLIEHDAWRLEYVQHIMREIYLQGYADGKMRRTRKLQDENVHD